MPFGYGTRKTRTKKSRFTRRAPRRKPSVSVKARPQRVALATKRDLMRLTKQVRYNTRQAMGDLQKSTQKLNWTTTAEDAWVSIQTPHAILHQALQDRSPIYGLRKIPGPPPGGTYLLSSINPASWGDYSLANIANQFVPAADVFDVDALEVYDNQRQYKSALGVQSKYVHYKSEYVFNFYAVSCTGYYQIDLICPKRVLRPASLTTTQEETTYNVGAGLQGFIGLAGGTLVQNFPNPVYFSRKRLARGYFNTAGDPASVENQQLHTNPNFQVNFTIRNHRGKKLIVCSQNDPTIGAGFIQTPAEIPTEQQMWIVISSSINEHQQNGNNHLKYHCVRTNWWRDYLGASH